MKIDNGSQFAQAAIMAVLLALTPTVGCAKKQVDPWTPKPFVHWGHLATQPIEPVEEGYRILVAQPTQGLFPASIAVTRIGMEIVDDRIFAATPCLLSDPRNEFLRWNSALDDQMAVSEVFPIVSRDLGGRAASPEQVLAAFRALHARMGLAYAVNELSSTETEMFGLLYDTASARPIASLHASAISLIPPEAQEDDDSTDMWETDSRALVRAKFEYLVHSCIRDLIRHDRPPLVESTSGWLPAGPILPVEWPPR